MCVTATRLQGRRRRPLRGGFVGDLLAAARENRAMVALALIFLAGMVVGSLYARSSGFRSVSRLDFLFAGNFKARLTQPFLSVFAASFASSFLFIFACFLCGLSMWGAFFIPVVPFFRGFGFGLTSGYLYAAYAWKGFLYDLAVLMPGAFLCCLAILLASLEGIRYSRALAFKGAAQAGGPPIRNYIFRFGIILALACAAAVLDTMLSAVFGGCFSF